MFKINQISGNAERETVLDREIPRERGVSETSNILCRKETANNYSPETKRLGNFNKYFNFKVFIVYFANFVIVNIIISLLFLFYTVIVQPNGN